MAKIGRKGGRSLGFNLEYARRLARLELLEKAEQVLFDAVNDETAPIRDRPRARPCSPRTECSLRGGGCVSGVSCHSTARCSALPIVLL
jgi:hypothetical protein